MTDNVVKLTEDVVITNKDYDHRVSFGHGYVTVSTDSDETLSRAEVLYYLELACLAYKRDSMTGE